MENTCYIYQPHFKTDCFRVAVKEQRGFPYNYIVVTCSPEYNGVWRYNVENCDKYDIWQNGRLTCYCVPTKDCVKLKGLNDLVNPNVIAKVKLQQTEWYNNTIKNRDYEYKNKPNWML